MVKNLLVLVACLATLQLVSKAQNVFDPNDPIVTYDASKPPVALPNAFQKWVTGKKVSWNTERFKSYIYDNLAFRLRYPNGYNPDDKSKKYPVILMMHGGGEIDTRYNNEYSLFVGAELFEKKIDSGLFNAFLLFPQSEVPGWEPYYEKINTILDTLEKYCQADPDRLITMGISMGGLAAVQYSMRFPQRSSIAIGSSPAVIQALSGRVNEFIQIPIWLGSGTLDGNPSVSEVQTFVTAFTDQGGFVRYNNFPVGHESWYPQWLEQPLVQNWNNAHKANPLAYYNKTQFSEETPVNVRLALTPGFAAYEWQKDDVSIPGATGNEITATGIGSYQARFRRTTTGTWSDWSHLPVVISKAVDDSIPPTPPSNLHVANTTTTTIELDWTISTDNTSIASYDVYENDVKKYSTSTSNITITDLTPNTVYRYVVRATDPAGNVSPSSNGIAARTKTIEATSGLRYKYFEGNWNELPDFAQLYPVKSGFTGTIDLSPRNADNFYSFVWEGYLKIPTSGNYTFELVSDDGSKMYFNGHYVSSDRALITNDRVHDKAMSVSSSVDAGAGVYPVAFTFFTKEGPGTMELYWSGPGITRQPVPASAFVTDVPPADGESPTTPTALAATETGGNYLNLSWNASTDNIGVMRYEIFENNELKYTSALPGLLTTGLKPNTSYNYYVRAIDRSGNRSDYSMSLSVKTSDPTVSGGLTYRYFEGDWDVLPDFNSLKAIKTGTSKNFDLDIRNVDDYFGVTWDGYINIPYSGDYVFELGSDDGSKFFFNSHYNAGATPLINNDGLHGINPVIKGSVNNLAAGTYPISMAYFEKWGDQHLQLYWTGPNLPRQLVPASAFSGSGQTLMAISGNITGTGSNLLMGDEANLSDAGGKIKFGTAFPNPFAEKFTINYMAAKANSQVDIQIFDLTGRLVTRKYFGQLPAGRSQLSMTLNTKETRRTIYLARVSVDGVPAKLIKLVRQAK